MIGTKLKSATAIARHLSVHRHTIRAWAKLYPNGPIKRTPKGRYYADMQELDAWMKKEVFK